MGSLHNLENFQYAFKELIRQTKKLGADKVRIAQPAIIAEIDATDGTGAAAAAAALYDEALNEIKATVDAFNSQYATLKAEFDAAWVAIYPA